MWYLTTHSPLWITQGRELYQEIEKTLVEEHSELATQENVTLEK